MREYYKKEGPLLGLQGGGGGVGYLAGSGGLTATGGTEITSGSFKYHVFVSNGPFQVSGSGIVEVLIIAGGAGGGARYYAGGGGAGGVVHGASVPVSGNYSVIVGSGGNGGAATYHQGGDGGESSFGPVIAYGGGGGGSYWLSGELQSATAGANGTGGVSGTSNNPQDGYIKITSLS